MGQRYTNCLGQDMPQIVLQKWNIFFYGSSSRRRTSSIDETKQAAELLSSVQVEHANASALARVDVVESIPSASTVPIIIQFLSGKCLELEVPEDASIFEVKRTIAQLEFIGDHHKLRLISGIEELADFESLKSYGVGAGSHLTLVVEFGCCSKSQNAIVGVMLAALEKQSLKPGSACFQRTWNVATAPEVSDDEFDRLVRGICGVNVDQHVYSDFIKVLGFWFEAGESWSMMNPRNYNGQVTQYSNNMKLFKHELYCELAKEACASVRSLASPELAFLWQTHTNGMVCGYELIGSPTVYPFSSNLLLHYYTPLQSILDGDRDYFIKPCRNVSLKHFLYALWDVAFQGNRRIYGMSSEFNFQGRKDFNPSDWTEVMNSSEPIALLEEDMLPLLHVQTQLSAGICPVVIDKEVRKYYACLLANANGCFLKVIDSSDWLDMEKLQFFIRECLFESGGQQDILIVVAGLTAFSNHVRLCSNLCRLNAAAQPRRLCVVLCVQRPEQHTEFLAVDSQL